MRIYYSIIFRDRWLIVYYSLNLYSLPCVNRPQEIADIFPRAISLGEDALKAPKVACLLTFYI